MKKNVFWLGLALCAGFVMTSCDDDDNQGNGGVTDLADDQPAAMVNANGFYMVNEGKGTNDGSVNYFKKNGAGYTISYRAYQAANDGEKLGSTTQFGTVWGDNMYLMTKQGNRLVVADAKTLKKKAAFQDLGGDPRMFLGVSDKKGYVSTSKGIRIFDIAQLQLGEAIADISVDEIGNMCLSAGKVFAVSAQPYDKNFAPDLTKTNHLYVIDVETDRVIKVVDRVNMAAMTCSKDGTVWVSTHKGFLKINPITLNMEEVAYPDGGKVYDSWYAWNAGSLCASTQKNVLYWASGTSSWAVTDIWKYDVEANQFSKIYTMHETDLGFVPNVYSAGLRVDPLTDELIVMGVYSYAQCWAYKLDSNGQELGCYPLLGGDGALPDGYNYWFPALPFFEDANQPQILLNQVKVKAGKTVEVNLEEKVVDYDNIFASMMFELTPVDGSLAEVALDGDDLKVKAGALSGVTVCKLAVISNGIRVEKNIQIVVE